jgi:hypothetical protein
MDPTTVTALDYPPGLAEEARRMALHLATLLGDLAEDIVLVGGLVPYLIIDQERAPEPHVGSRDIDLGFSVAVLGEDRYREISQRLRRHGFSPTRTEEGRTRRQTWKLRDEAITIDFLIGPVPGGPAPGKLQDLEPDFAAFVIPALQLAFIDTMTVVLEGRTTEGELARREIRVAGPAAFVVLKALSFRNRGATKDAYDLVYVLLNYGVVPLREVAVRFSPISHDPEARQALTILAEDFSTEEHVGPMRRAEFLGNRDDPHLRQDAAGAVLGFLELVREGP